MKKHVLMSTLLLAIAMMFTACDKSDTVTVSPDGQFLKVDVRSNDYNFTAHLSGQNEAPPNESAATGQCIVRIARDEESVHYRLIVANAENVFASHFHMAPEGVNGPVVAFLFGGPAVEEQNGVLAEGTIEAADVIGPLAGDLDALIDRIRSGMIYVNVHTTQIPSGEIRGQVE